MSQQPLGTQTNRPQPDEVLRELSAILASAAFRSSPLLQRLLKYIIEASLTERGIAHNATTIARLALGKSTSFRSSKDASVRVAMGRLRKALQLYYASEGARDPIEISLEPGNYSPGITWRRPVAPSTPTDLVLQLAAKYQEIMTPAANGLVMRQLRGALKLHPDDACLLAAYFDMCNDDYKFGFGNLERPLDEATWAIERAVSIAPDHPAVQFQMGFFALLQNNLAEAKEFGNTLMQTYSDDPEFWLRGCFLTCQASDPQLGTNLFKTPQAVSEIGPSWVNITPFLAAYQREDYEAALTSAINFGLPNFFWGPTLRAAVLAQLGLGKAASSQLSRTLGLNPQFAKAPRWFLSHHIKDQDALEHVLEGLHRAGLRP